MADIHLKTGGAAVSPFATWANAATTFAGSVAPMVAGDTLYVSPAHAESVAGIAVTVPGSSATPSRILCGTEGGSSGITAIGSGGVIESSNTTFTVSGSFHCEGVTWRATSGSFVQLNLAATTGSTQSFNNCKFEVTGAHTGASIKFGATSAGGVCAATVRNPIFKLGNAVQRIFIDYTVRIIGGSFDSSLAVLAGVFNLGPSGRGANLLVEDMDLSTLATNVNIVGVITNSGNFAVFRRLKLPAAWTGGLVAAGQVRQGDRIEMADASSGATKYLLWIEAYAGSVRDESTVKVTAQPRAYKMASSANCSIVSPLRSQDYYVPLSGAAQTLTMEICTDNVTLTDQQCWLAVDYFSAAGSLLGTTVTDAAATIITAGTAQTTSAAVWTTTGLATPVKQVLSVAVTAGEASHAIVRVVVVRPSTTVYISDAVQVA